MCPARESVVNALWGMCAADAMSMPVHWFYNTRDITRDFGGWIRGLNAPRERHPSSILTLSNTGGSGRIAGSSRIRAPVVGNVILHDKLKFWMNPSGSVHYHQGLQAGENTLNTLCALRVARVLSSGQFRSVAEADARAAVLSDYVKFMTTPGTHDDTYAESFHRSFFCDWQELKPTSSREVLEFAERRSKRMLKAPVPDSQLNVIGCLPMAVPFVLLSANEEEAVSAAVEFVNLTHPHPELKKFVSLYARALYATLNGACVKQQAETALKSPALNAWHTCQHFIQRAESFSGSSEERLKVHQRAVESLGLACYIQGSVSSLFYLAYSFHNDVTEGILTNTNCGDPHVTYPWQHTDQHRKLPIGGENCNRGAALGALLGARGAFIGSVVPQKWKDGLKNAQKPISVILNDLP